MKQTLTRVLGGLMVAGIVACVFIVIFTAAALVEWLSK
jgi:hypothetical protein